MDCINEIAEINHINCADNKNYINRILLIYPPFCTPATPPHSITNIHSFLKINLSKNHVIKTLDLNIIYHKKQFLEFYKFFRKTNFNKDYDQVTRTRGVQQDAEGVHG